MTERRTVLIRYDEIGLKGRNRKFFEKCLLRNIKRVLSSGTDDIVYRSPRAGYFWTSLQVLRRNARSG